MSLGTDQARRSRAVGETSAASRRPPALRGSGTPPAATAGHSPARRQLRGDLRCTRWAPPRAQRCRAARPTAYGFEPAEPRSCRRPSRRNGAVSADPASAQSSRSSVMAPASACPSVRSGRPGATAAAPRVTRGSASGPQPPPACGHRHGRIGSESGQALLRDRHRHRQSSGASGIEQVERPRRHRAAEFRTARCQPGLQRQPCRDRPGH